MRLLVCKSSKLQLVNEQKQITAKAFYKVVEILRFKSNYHLNLKCLKML